MLCFALLCFELLCFALLCYAMLCFALHCVLRNTSVDPCISMHGSQWARSLRGLVVVLSDGGLSGSSAMPLGIHSWKSGKAAEYLKIHIFAVDSPFFPCWPERPKVERSSRCRPEILDSKPFHYPELPDEVEKLASSQSCPERRQSTCS